MEVRSTKRNFIAVYVYPVRQALQSAAPPGLVDFLFLLSTGLRPWLRAIAPPGLVNGTDRRTRRRCLQQWSFDPPAFSANQQVSLPTHPTALHSPRAGRKIPRRLLSRKSVSTTRPQAETPNQTHPIIIADRICDGRSYDRASDYFALAPYPY